METKVKKRIAWRALCPLRLGVLLGSLAWLGGFALLREDRARMNALCDALVRPWHRFAGALYDALPFSAAELYIALGVLAAAAFLARLVVLLVRRGGWARLYRWALTLLSVAAALCALFTLWWGVFYYADGFAEQSGLAAAPVAAEDLERVTAWFAELANDAAGEVPRDGEGVYAPDTAALLARSASLYENAQELFPCLAGPALHAKPVLFSRVMSYLNNTGFFFPFTAEANVNTDMPPSLLPATVAHELAHQRGVAAEDEANFVAVLACLESGDADYTYSAALMAYIYLGNALQRADYEAWLRVYESLSDAVRADLRVHSAYWQRFQTPVKEVSDKVYTSFLKTYGDERGMQSYGACVDLLVAYYGAAAKGAGAR